jgi:hypothetical protein
VLQSVAQDLLCSGQPFPCGLAGVMMTVAEIAHALRALHAKRIVHRDLKPAVRSLVVSSGVTKQEESGRRWP